MDMILAGNRHRALTLVADRLPQLPPDRQALLAWALLDTAESQGGTLMATFDEPPSPVNPACAAAIALTPAGRAGRLPDEAPSRRFAELAATWTVRDGARDAFLEVPLTDVRWAIDDVERQLNEADGKSKRHALLTLPGIAITGLAASYRTTHCGLELPLRLLLVAVTVLAIATVLIAARALWARGWLGEYMGTQPAGNSLTARLEALHKINQRRNARNEDERLVLVMFCLAVAAFVFMALFVGAR